jgi:hypothetical protein
MKKMKLVLIAIAFAVSTSVFADVTSSNTNTTGADASNQGNSQNITFTAPASTTQTVNSNSTSNSTSTSTQNINNTQSGTSTQHVEYSGSQTVNNVPSVSGPALTTSNDTCMGSTSGSVNIAGIGIGGGGTWTDNNCKRLKNARELWNMGMKAAALALLCNDPENKEALEMTGYKCPSKPAAADTSTKRNYNLSEAN